MTPEWRRALGFARTMLAVFAAYFLLVGALWWLLDCPELRGGCPW